MLDYRRYIREVKEVIVSIVKLKFKEFRKVNYSFRGNNNQMEISNLINSLLNIEVARKLKKLIYYELHQDKKPRISYLLIYP